MFMTSVILDKSHLISYTGFSNPYNSENTTFTYKLWNIQLVQNNKQKKIEGLEREKQNIRYPQVK